MRFLAYAFFIFFGFALQAQNGDLARIIGKVKDSKTKTAIANANVVLHKTHYGTSTNHNGEFKFKELIAGEYFIKISVVGYQKYEKKIELKPNQQLELEVELKDSMFSMGEVQISASRNDDLLKQPLRITIINSKSIESAPIQNIHELIDYSAGTTMSNALGIYSSNVVVSLHGLPTNNQSRTLILLDGVPLNNSDGGSVNWNMIDKNNIETIKITKGPGPAKFGSGAMGGVIEMTSKIPHKKLEANLGIDYGTYNTMSSNINIGGKYHDTVSNDQLYWRLTGFGRKSDGYMAELTEYYTILDTFFVPVYLQEYSINSKIGFQHKNRQRAELQFGFFDDKRGNGEKVWEDLGAYSTHQTQNITGLYSENNKFSKLNFTVFSTTENYIRQYEYISDGGYTLYEANATRRDLGGDFNMIYTKFHRHEIQYGLSFKQGKVKGSDTYFTSSDVIYNQGLMDNYSLYFQDEMKFMSEKIIINLGFRYDYARFHDALFVIESPSYSLQFYEDFENWNIPNKNWNAFSPRFFAQYIFNHENRIYLSIAKGFRAPTLDDMTRNGNKKGSFRIANPDLNPEIMTTIETGTDFMLFDKISASGSIYYSIGRDFMYNINNGDSVNMGYKIAPILQTQNIGKVEIYGAELELKTKIATQLDLFANIAFTHAQIKEYSIINPQADSNLTGKFLTDVPNIKMSAGIEWKTRFFNSVLLVKHVGETWVNELNTIDIEYLKTDKLPKYTLLNLKFERKIRNEFNIGLSIENIFDKYFITSDFQRNPGRLIRLSLKYQLL